ncbi:M3 family oligoendopeptidase, partial [Romboutsia sp. 1001216sp1]|nr:M3 family oligoendopeptidase [Romboutsia sp. 1001216sp1]
MKFSDFEYERPNYEKSKNQIIEIINNIENSKTYKEQRQNIDKLNSIRNNIETMSTLCSIRHSINVEDEFYEREKVYWDEYSPLYEELNSLFYKSVVNSKFKEDIQKDFGRQFINIASFNLKSFSSEIIKDLQEENKLCSKYTKLLASAKI